MPTTGKNDFLLLLLHKNRCLFLIRCKLIIVILLFLNKLTFFINKFLFKTFDNIA